ncbi:alcohol dehydrogenase catalytic domain-containing protein [Actinosynnema sp. NPDC020468]|uniref:alcohol dehydrogenase catalytic domain-containing protein n=1 Tax=Actinosynnema sp. NPDC020468 TaxID=3154488 RepID=UPI0033FE50AD
MVPGRAEAGRVGVVEWGGGAGEVVVQGLLVGVCATDVEIVRDGFGELPVGRREFVLFHESLGRVVAAPDGAGVGVGDLVVGVVRRPDPVPCAACAVGAWDFCRNGRYLERGIKGLDGYGVRRWSVPAGFAVRVDAGLADAGVLVEPASVVAKAWAQVEAQCVRTYTEPRTALITGAGPVGLLAALFGVQRGLDVHVVDQVSDGPKPGLVKRLGARYHRQVPDMEVDVAIECTGNVEVIRECLRAAGVTVLAGLSGHRDEVVVGSEVFDGMVLGNRSVTGTVNAGLEDYRTAAAALADADRGWLHDLITRRVPLHDFTAAFDRHDDDVKVVVDLTA